MEARRAVDGGSGPWGESEAGRKEGARRAEGQEGARRAVGSTNHTRTFNELFVLISNKT